MKTFTKLMMASAFTVVLATPTLPAYAGPYEDGLAAVEVKNYRQAINKFTPLANTGNANAQFELAKLYISGLVTDGIETGVRDPAIKKQGGDWLRLASDNGLVEAQREMFALYIIQEYGIGFEEGKKYQRMAAEQGDASSQYFVGLDYRDDKKYAQARLWLEKAISQGYEDAAKAFDKLPPVLFSKDFSIYDRNVNTGPLTRAQIRIAEEAGYAAYTAGNYIKAIKLWTPAGEAGSAKAQTNLAKMYVNAQGTGQSKEKAFYWIDKALGQEYAPAFSVTAELHQKGIFFPADWKKAYEFYERASELGEGRGAYFIGMAQEDWGNIKDALELYERAARRGFPDAQAKLALMYEQGTGVDVDLNKAMQWHLKAAQQDFQYSIYAVGVNYKNGSGVPKSLALANHWFKRGARIGDGACLISLDEAARKQIKTDIFLQAKTKAESGNAKAQYKLAQLYNTGQGTEKSTAIAKYWLEKSATQNFSKALFDLANYYDSMGSRDMQKSKMLYLKLAENLQEPREVIARAIKAYDSGDYGLAFPLALPYANGGNKYAQSITGKMYQWGRGVSMSKEKALSYYKKAGDQGLAGAQYSAGYIHQYGNEHLYAARSWYKLAAAQDHPEALVALAHFYRKGNGADKNRDEAIRLYAKAESLGHDGAANYKRLTQQEKWDEKRRAQARAAQAARARVYYNPPKKRNKWSFRTMVEDAVSNSYNNSNSFGSYNSTSSSYSGYSTASPQTSYSSSTRSPYATYTAPPKVSPYEYRYKGAWTIDGPKY